MSKFEYEPTIDEIAKKLLGAQAFEEARQELIAEKRRDCKEGRHRWMRVAYDLQGGKWGQERCMRCGHEETWYV